MLHWSGAKVEPGATFLSDNPFCCSDLIEMNEGTGFFFLFLNTDLNIADLTLKNYEFLKHYIIWWETYMNHYHQFKVNSHVLERVRFVRHRLSACIKDF